MGGAYHSCCLFYFLCFLILVVPSSDLWHHSLSATKETRFVYNGWNLISETDSSGDIEKSYTWGLDASGSTQGAGGVGGLLMIKDGGNTYVPVYDSSHNVIALHEKNNPTTHVAGYDYDAFGRSKGMTGTYARTNPFRHATKYTDDETGLVYYGFRYYNPRVGRFLNQDPIREAGGVNLYGFVGNDPVNSWDYLGLSFGYTPVPGLLPSSHFHDPSAVPQRVVEGVRFIMVTGFALAASQGTAPYLTAIRSGGLNNLAINLTNNGKKIGLLGGYFYGGAEYTAGLFDLKSTNNYIDPSFDSGITLGNTILALGSVANAAGQATGGGLIEAGRLIDNIVSYNEDHSRRNLINHSEPPRPTSLWGKYRNTAPVMEPWMMDPDYHMKYSSDHIYDTGETLEWFVVIADPLEEEGGNAGDSGASSREKEKKIRRLAGYEHTMGGIMEVWMNNKLRDIRYPAIGALNFFSRPIVWENSNKEVQSVQGLYLGSLLQSLESQIEHTEEVP